jgi:hypothetical protein
VRREVRGALSSDRHRLIRRYLGEDASADEHSTDSAEDLDHVLLAQAGGGQGGSNSTNAPKWLLRRRISRAGHSPPEHAMRAEPPVGADFTLRPVAVLARRWAAGVCRGFLLARNVLWCQREERPDAFWYVATVAVAVVIGVVLGRQ